MRNCGFIEGPLLKKLRGERGPGVEFLRVENLETET
jgi:hypothetical protein